MSDAEVHHSFRPLGRGGVAGLLLTLGIHGALVYLVYHSQVKSEPAPVATRNLIVTRMVRLEKPRQKNWLPRVVQPPPPQAPPPEIKLTQNPLAPPTPPPPKEAPKPQDTQISKDMKRALERARALANAAKQEEPDEGSALGSPTGTDTEQVIGDDYATQVHDAIRANWSAAAGLLNDAQLARLSAEVRIQIDADGTLRNPSLAKSSGNDLYDDSCLQAVRATGRVPPPPAPRRAQARRGFILEFAGKDLPR